VITASPRPLALTPVAGLPYKPHATANGDKAREADLSTQQAGAQAPSRISRPPQDHGRPQGACRPTGTRPQAAQRLRPARTPASAMERLRQRADFLAVATGARAPATGFVLQARDRRENGPVRVGFTVSKKVGNAVERNRVRRRLREVVRLGPQARMRRGYDYVLIGRRSALELPFDRLIEDFERALGRVHSAPADGEGTGTTAGKRAAAFPHAGTR
jgi:ribonuclease P protein component